MSRLGFRKVVVYGGGTCLGEVDVVPVVGKNFQFPNNEIRLHRISAISERCHPLAVLQTISASVRCKLEPSLYPTTDQSELMKLHASCFYERKTAVAIIGNEELHLVAMPSKLNRFPCFWCYSVPVVGTLYHSCLEMLNIRCLAIVFDLDETLIVANTMKSFKDKIEALRGRIARESDPIRSSGMTAEMNRYIEDRSLLKQYVKSDSLVDNGKFHKAKLEYTTQERGFRPVIRLLEKNVVLTRIIPENRDTSVLVRLRPAWDELKSYLTANGRKRFEVYVCTKAEKEYALEMWRLLDPNANLIRLNQRMNRIVSVKHGTKKSLNNVFQEGSCHPKMAMVIDDRIDVWDDKDKPRVHVLPAFTPYHSPAAETINSVPVLRVVRDVVCNARGKFFKEFDESFLHKISAASYEDDVVSFPVSPEVVPNAVEVVPSSFKKPSNLVGSQNKLPANMNEYTTVETWNYIPPVAIHALLEFGRQLNSTVEFNPVARKNDYFGYSFEIWFGGEMAGIGVGKTMKDAQLQAADKAIRALTDKYLSYNQKQTLNKIWTRGGDPLVGC